MENGFMYIVINTYVYCYHTIENLTIQWWPKKVWKLIVSFIISFSSLSTIPFTLFPRHFGN